MPDQRADITVVGLGAVGSGAVYRLAQRGLSVAGIERFAPGHDRGSSHGLTRVIRKAYFEAPDYVPLLERAYELWDEIEDTSGEEIFLRTGVLEVGPPNGEVVPGVLRAAKEHNLDVHPLESGEIEDRFPGFRVPAHLSGVFEADGGILKVERCVELQAELARQKGAQLRTNTSVQRIERVGSGYRLHTNNGILSTGALIVTAGAWAQRLIPELNPHLKVLRKVLLWYNVNKGGPSYKREEHSPVFLFELPEGVFYGFPVLDELGLKLAEHSGGNPVSDPLKLDRALYPADHAPVEGFLKEYMPNVDPRLPTKHAVCMYTISPDLHPIAGRHPGEENLFFAAGLSGHGFKFSTALGEALADLATDGSSRVPMDIFKPDRFLA